jgi:hypothetical protein
MGRLPSIPTSSSDRTISLVSEHFKVPERLLLAHARGEVLFIAGAGISRPSNLPDFRGLVLEVYARLESATHAVLTAVPQGACSQWNERKGYQASNALKLIGSSKVTMTLFSECSSGEWTGQPHGRVRSDVQSGTSCMTKALAPHPSTGR